MTNKKFLVVEDSLLMRSHIRDILNRNFNVEIIELNNGSELYNYLENAETDDINLILLDINLPDINGITIAKKLQYSERYKPIPIIIISGSIRTETVLTSLKVGVKDVLVKPINENDFVMRVTRVINDSNTGKLICNEEKKVIQNFTDVIRIEMKKAERAKYPLTILLIGFVREDTMGSPFTGIDCQQNLEFGSQYYFKLKNMLRETDTIIRLSSLESLIILPFSDEEGAETVKKKLQHLSCDEGIKKLLLIVSSVTHCHQGESVDVLINNLERKYKSLLVVKTLNLLSE